MARRFFAGPYLINCYMFKDINGEVYVIYKITIPLSELKVGMMLADPMQVANSQGEIIVVLPHNYEITDKAILALKRVTNFNASTISIYSRTPQLEDAVNVKDVDTSKPPEPLIVERDSDVHPQPITLIKEEVRDDAIDGIRSLFTTADQKGKGSNNLTTAYQIVTNLDKIMDELVETVTANPKGLVPISSLKSYDEYTYHHSLSVSVLAIAIGQALGLNIRESKRLGRCAMLHDIGKIMVPHNLITKPAALTPGEYMQVKKHPEMGARYLKTEFIGNDELWDSIIHHHEKVDGTGYPEGLLNKEIPLFSKIIAVADVYDALTSYRPYRDPMRPPANAIEMVMSEVGTAFDYDVVHAFVNRIELYPIGSILQLSDNRVGKVIDNRNYIRPKLKLLGKNEIVDLATIENLNLVIVAAEVD